MSITIRMYYNTTANSLGLSNVLIFTSNEVQLVIDSKAMFETYKSQLLELY
jgi:hypothetical protein